MSRIDDVLSAGGGGNRTLTESGIIFLRYFAKKSIGRPMDLLFNKTVFNYGKFVAGG